MWDFFVGNHVGDTEIDLEESFYCGDAGKIFFFLLEINFQIFFLLHSRKNKRLETKSKKRFFMF